MPNLNPKLNNAFKSHLNTTKTNMISVASTKHHQIPYDYFSLVGLATRRGMVKLRWLLNHICWPCCWSLVAMRGSARSRPTSYSNQWHQVASQAYVSEGGSVATSVMLLEARSREVGNQEAHQWPILQPTWCHAVASGGKLPCGGLPPEAFSYCVLRDGSAPSKNVLCKTQMFSYRRCVYHMSAIEQTEILALQCPLQT